MPPLPVVATSLVPSLDEAMEEKLAALDLPKLKVRNRIKAAILTRLALLAPNKEAARRATALMTLPMHAGLAARMMYRTVDAMWRAAGDTSTDFNFYSKRGILAGVYGSVLVRWFNDTGEDEKATQDFLDARIENRDSPARAAETGCPRVRAADQRHALREADGVQPIFLDAHDVGIAFELKQRVRVHLRG